MTTINPLKVEPLTAEDREILLDLAARRVTNVHTIVADYKDFSFMLSITVARHIESRINAAKGVDN